MSRKVFTAGEVLAAADVNSFLMDQTVMSFAGTAARGSAIASPTLGMYTHLEDSAPAPRLQFWNGSAWASPLGTTLVGSSSFSGVTSVALDNVFTSAYENYEIYFSASATSASGINFNLRAGGVPLTTATYDQTFIRCENTTLTGNNNSGSTNWFPLTVRNATTPNFTKITLSNPATSGRSKSYIWQTQDRSSVNLVDVGAGRNTTTTVFDGFVLSGSASMTGTLYVYGLRK
jgi:hypothetical protein